MISTELSSHCGQMIRYRALIAALVKRHLAIRYRGSMLGFLWSFLNPLCLMLVYSLVFQYYIRFSAVPNYTIFLFCGLLPWLWTTSALIEGTASIVSGGHLITKSLFPALILPGVSVITHAAHFIFALPLLFSFIFFAGLPFHATILLLPILIVVHALFLHGLALALASLNVYLRDVQHIVGNLLTFIFFLCPILYSVEVVPEKFRFTLALNPFSLLTMAYQNLILYGTVPDAASLATLSLYTVAALIIGTTLYERYHEGFAEVV